jgi:hypothetical protein
VSETVPEQRLPPVHAERDEPAREHVRRHAALAANDVDALDGLEERLVVA